MPHAPLLAELWERGRAAGLHLGTLYVLARPLFPGRRATYHRDSGDIWVWLDERDPNRAAADLLHELAHAYRRDNRHVVTIGGYCRDEIATHRLAHQLARRWGVPHLFPDQLLHEYIALMQARREELPLAGELVGARTLSTADAALEVLQALAHAHGWSGAAWDDMLWGDAHEPGSPGYRAIADLDRCLLRPSWNLGWGYGEDFERLTAAPTAQAARLLRTTLQEAARRGRAILHATTRRRRRYGTARRVGQYPMHHLRDLVPFVVAANQALLGERAWDARACWGYYSDEHLSIRYYTLSVGYTPPFGPPPASPVPLAVDLRAAAFGNREIDATLQMYMRGWRRSTALRRGALGDALEEWAHEDNTVEHIY